MKIHTHRERGAHVIEIRGNMVGGPENSDRFHSTVKEILAEGPPAVVLDLTDCAYVQSPGVGMIMRAYTSIGTAGGSLKLVVDTERVRNLFNLIQLYRVLEIHETRESALDALEASAEA